MADGCFSVTFEVIVPLIAAMTVSFNLANSLIYQVKRDSFCYLRAKSRILNSVRYPKSIFWSRCVFEVSTDFPASKQHLRP
jgi:hypothetical protein